MSQQQPTALSRLWYRWKSLQLPWRRKRLVGVDLAGTTFWEFRDALVVGRLRRMAKAARGTPYSDIHISPAWHQWLRHTRETPPSLAEQEADVTRQLQLRELARLADKRWAEKPSVLDAPSKVAQAAPASGLQSGWEPTGGEKESGSKDKDDRPWKTPAKSNPGDSYQPSSWSPASTTKKKTTN